MQIDQEIIYIHDDTLTALLLCPRLRCSCWFHWERMFPLMPQILCVECEKHSEAAYFCTLAEIRKTESNCWMLCRKINSIFNIFRHVSIIIHTYISIYTSHDIDVSNQWLSFNCKMSSTTWVMSLVLFYYSSMSHCPFLCFQIFNFAVRGTWKVWKLPEWF